ncbi:Uncharacterized protein APZ42_001942 [Daphnia magna]|uniref:Uncharacterized protein n=1 Tax=Daphnia magna TaxID=35525 RepID=A0A164IMF7_9CRUS|nr:Uncharacterized protein APZ42_001942 [Daphnia magna]
MLIRSCHWPKPCRNRVHLINNLINSVTKDKTKQRLVKVEKQTLDQKFYSHTLYGNSGMLAVIAEHSLVL